MVLSERRKALFLPVDSLVLHVGPDDRRVPADRIAVRLPSPEPRSPEIFFLDLRKLLKEFPPRRSLERLVDVAEAVRVPQLDVHMHVVAVKADLLDDDAGARCHLEENFLAARSDFREVEDRMAVTHLVAHVQLNARDAGAAMNKFNHELTF